MGFPSTYRQLLQYAIRFKEGDTIYPQGVVPDRVYVVLRGRIDFCIVDPNGEIAVVAEGHPGHLAGHIAAISGRPTSASAVASEDAVLLGIPVAELGEAFKVAPELALDLLAAFAGRGDGRAVQRTVSQAVVDVTAEPTAVADPPPAAKVGQDEVARLKPGADETFFFSDTTTCPISGTTFEFLRVRTSGVRPSSRDSDFRVVYATHDPARYSIVVCPQCGYAAYLDDFGSLTDDERKTLVASQAQRDALGARDFSGMRDLDAAGLAIDLALQSYAGRASNERRRAVLLHRRSWIARERGDVETELLHLGEARDAYREAFERDASISDESAMRAAYIIGDLSLRLGEVAEAIRWLETATRFPDAKKQSGLTRQAWERLQDARTAGKREKQSAA